MAIYWMTEAIPLPVTALIPVFLFPLLEILPTETVCVAYMKEVNMMFIGGIVVALAVESCGLHDRIALRVILIIGTSPVRLMLGLMLTTMFLSMWISNTAATAMMTPIVRAVLDELRASDAERRRSLAPLSEEDLELYGSQIKTLRKSSFFFEPFGEEEQADKLDICLYLSIAYAANVGGTGTLTGTGTNLIFKGIYDELFPNAHGVTYASWMLFCIPVMLIITFAAWIWLQIRYMGLFRKNSEYRKIYKLRSTIERSQKVREIIHIRYEEKGSLTFHQIAVTFIFVCVVLLWFFREPEFMPGWVDFSSVKIKDSTPVMLSIFLMHAIPSNLDFLRVRKKRHMKSAPGLLTWKIIHEKTPWGVFVLLGGGFAMAAACDASGLSRFLGDVLKNLKVMPAPAILIIVLIFIKCLTEIGSNSAIANIMLPILAEMSTGMDMHPLYFMLPATLCCSYAFMLPVSTPPNAIVQAACNMKSSEMMKSGIMMHFISLVVLVGCFFSFGVYIYDTHSYNKTDFI